MYGWTQTKYNSLPHCTGLINYSWADAWSFNIAFACSTLSHKRGSENRYTSVSSVTVDMKCRPYCEWQFLHVLCLGLIKLAIHREDKRKIIKGSLWNLLFAGSKMNTAGQIIFSTRGYLFIDLFVFYLLMLVLGTLPILDLVVGRILLRGPSS